MRYILAAIGFLIMAASPALAFYQQTILFQKALFVDEADEGNASKKTNKQTAKKWRIAFTNPMS